MLEPPSYVQYLCFLQNGRDSPVSTRLEENTKKSFSCASVACPIFSILLHFLLVSSEERERERKRDNGRWSCAHNEAALSLSLSLFSSISRSPPAVPWISAFSSPSSSSSFVYLHSHARLRIKDDARVIEWTTEKRRRKKAQKASSVWLRNRLFFLCPSPSLSLSLSLFLFLSLSLLRIRTTYVSICILVREVVKVNRVRRRNGTVAG